MSFLQCPFQESNEITRDIPDLIDGNPVTYDFIEDVALNPNDDKYNSLTDKEKQSISKIYDRLKELFQKYPIVYSGVKNLAGTISNTGLHAGGVIVSSKPINENAAIIDGGDTAVLPVIQFEMGDLDFFGWLNIWATVKQVICGNGLKLLVQSLPFVKVYVRNNPKDDSSILLEMFNPQAR